jgi:methylenetetrahydrofolate reductase (NADPH)
MKVAEHLAAATEPLISFEIIPPKRGGRIKDLLDVVDGIVRYGPKFIDVTSHGAEVIYEETPGGIRKKVKRKRPGTLGICALIQSKYGIDAVPHVLCEGFTREETEDFLIDIQYLGIENIMALRGDAPAREKIKEGERTFNRTARDLVVQAANMNRGVYLEDLLDAEPSSFCIGVAGYPEKHYAAPNLETDIRNLKDKVDAGADYVVTQMFFDNAVYFRFVDACRAAGVSVPIIPGIKIVHSRHQLTSVPQSFHVNIPFELSEEILRSDEERAVEAGVRWTARQAGELLEHKVPAIHFYVTGRSDPIDGVMRRLGM